MSCDTTLAACVTDLRTARMDSFYPKAGVSKKRAKSSK